jgi:hypothetical protein
MMARVGSGVAEDKAKVGVENWKSGELVGEGGGIIGTQAERKIHNTQYGMLKINAYCVLRIAYSILSVEYCIIGLP